MNWKVESLLGLRVVLAAALGGVVGWQRLHTGREAGIRTFAAVSLGACVFGLISLHAAVGAETTRISSNVVTGIGFLCAGVILREQGHITGLTTAASLWATASIGLAVAYGMHVLGVLVAMLLFGLLAIPKRWEQRWEPPGVPRSEIEGKHDA